jgi:hypothetical protein
MTFPYIPRRTFLACFCSSFVLYNIAAHPLPV